MAPQMTSQFSTSNHKLDRKLLKKPDGFLSAISRVFDGLFDHNRVILTLVGALIMVGSATAFFLTRMDHKTQGARTALYEAGKTFETESKNSAGAKTDVETQFKESFQKLKALEQNFPKTGPAHEARLKIANIYFNHGDYEKALPWFEKAAETASNRFEKVLALAAVGYTLENLKKGNAAIQTFQKAIDLGESSIKGELLIAMARCYEELHDSGKARSTYDRILSELPNTEYARNAEVYKNQL